MSNSNDISKIVPKLFPTGRAWNYARQTNKGTEFTDGVGDIYTDGHEESFTTGISAINGKAYIEAKYMAYQRMCDDVFKMIYQALPDNDLFSELDASNWERVFQIVTDPSKSLEDRKQTIFNRYSYPNGIAERQTKDFIESQIRAEGFDVYLHENRFQNLSEFEVVNPIPSIFGQAAFGRMVFGNTGIAFTEVVKNYIEVSLDGNIEYDQNTLNNLFFIGGPAYGDFANVPTSRKDEFRQLILTYKPLHSAAVLQINYI